MTSSLSNVCTAYGRFLSVKCEYEYAVAALHSESTESDRREVNELYKEYKELLGTLKNNVQKDD